MSPDLRSLNAAGEIKSANIHVQNIEAFDALAKALGNDDLRKIEARMSPFVSPLRTGASPRSPSI